MHEKGTAMANRVGRNEPCPCGSDKKYKRCCWGKSFDYVENDEGEIHREIPMSNELADVFKEQEQHFIDTFGRKPGPGDKVFFDAPPLEHMEHEMVQAMQEAGMRPDFVYAFIKTNGLLVTEDNRSLIPEKDLQEWEAALDEYHDRYGEVLAIRLPWTKSEIKGKLIRDVCDSPRTTKFFADYRKFVLTDPDTRKYYTRIVTAGLSGVPFDELDSFSEEQLGNLKIGDFAESLLRVLSLAQQAVRGMDAVTAFEFSLFADDFVTAMKEKMNVAKDERIVEGLDAVRMASIGLFFIAMNQHFGFDEVPERPRKSP
jgi:hypothetical protein